MMLGAWSPLEWLALVEHELLLFAGVFFIIGAADELAMDLAWVWLRLTGRARTLPIGPESFHAEPLLGDAAVLILAWQEEQVLATTNAHALAVWPQRELRIYAGCYRNDSATAAAILVGAGGDPRVRMVVHDRDGPTTKADCLNCLYAAMEADERRSGMRFRMVLLQDAEDMVAVTELPPAELPFGFRGEAYAQGGYVGGTFAIAFVDGQARADKEVMRIGRGGQLRLGGAISGGAQKQAERLDAGPSAAISLRLGEAHSRLILDYRFRVAGDAEPGNGPALTFSAGF